jgi:predicted RNase H-like nuclease (RuvC/YqgF family)
MEEDSGEDLDDDVTIQCLPLKRKIREDATKIQELEAKIEELEKKLKHQKTLNNKLNKKCNKLKRPLK